MASLTVLGLGNILMTDEGVGVRLMEAVRDAHPWPEQVEFIDGGAGGLGLLNVIERAERLVVFDAADMELRISDFGLRIASSKASGEATGRNSGTRNQEPGERLDKLLDTRPGSGLLVPPFLPVFRIITPDQLLDEPADGRTSMHDMPFAQTLALCRQFTRCPDDVTIMAIQPADISPGRQLSPTIQLAFKALVQAGEELVQGKLT